MANGGLNLKPLAGCPCSSYCSYNPKLDPIPADKARAQINASIKASVYNTTSQY